MLYPFQNIFLKNIIKKELMCLNQETDFEISSNHKSQGTSEQHSLDMAKKKIIIPSSENIG